MDIGIIGGADGPTTIFLTSETNLYTIIAVVIIPIVVLGIIIWIKNKKKVN
jgi:Na+-transporting methylmalonyl-CoA/oxaloacetate decarboxylase beta subunit